MSDPFGHHSIPPSREPIAITGMSCRFPKAPNLEAFWQLLERGGDAISEVPADRFDVNAFYDPDPDAPGKMYVREGGFIENVFDFALRSKKSLEFASTRLPPSPLTRAQMRFRAEDLI